MQLFQRMSKNTSAILELVADTDNAIKPNSYLIHTLNDL